MTDSDLDVKTPAPSTGEGETKLAPPDQQTTDPAPSLAESVMAAVDAPDAPTPPADPTTPAVAPTQPAAPTTEADFDPMDQDEDLSPEIKSLDREHYSRIAKGVDRLRDKLREARREGEAHKTLMAAAKTAGMEVADVEWWHNLGLRANSGDPEAVRELRTVLADIAPETPAPAAPAAKPAEDLAEKVYNERFAQLVEDAEISETLARKMSKDLAAQTSEAVKPAPSQPVVPTPPVAAPNFVARAAAETLKTLEAQYAAKLPNYAEVKTEVLKRIEAEKRERGRPLPATMWVSDYVTKIREVQMARMRAPAAPTGASALRPSTTQTSIPAGSRRSLDDVKSLVAAGRFDDL